MIWRETTQANTVNHITIYCEIAWYGDTWCDNTRSANTYCDMPIGSTRCYDTLVRCALANRITSVNVWAGRLWGRTITGQYPSYELYLGQLVVRCRNKPQASPVKAGGNTTSSENPDPELTPMHVWHNPLPIIWLLLGLLCCCYIMCRCYVYRCGLLQPPSNATPKSPS